jgi:hypothetical protein
MNASDKHLIPLAHYTPGVSSFQTLSQVHLQLDREIREFQVSSAATPRPFLTPGLLSSRLTVAKRYTAQVFSHTVGGAA